MQDQLDPRIESAPVAALEERDKPLLNSLQWDFPLTERPFLAIGEGLGMEEDEVLRRIDHLRRAHVIRQISAIFDSRRLGYKSSLVAMRFPKEIEDRAVEIVNAHPGVSHNYQRNHDFNMWFTLTIHPSKDLETEMNRLAETAAATAARLLPTLKLYKINVKLDVTGTSDAAAKEETPYVKPTGELTPITVDDILAIRELQLDMPTAPEPFAPMADRLGIPVEALLARARTFLDNGRMRRFAAVLHHQTAGFTHNAMSVWKVPDETDVDRCGRIIAGFKSVSHAYKRPVYPDWPYPLFGMIHGRCYEDCHAVAEAIRAETGLAEYALLFSTKEWKKIRVQYFLETDMTTEEMAAPVA
ncbi:MAG TPA: Lrp/AsnC family transcriptional regulator [Armatimonadota bacterium]|jgi:DNA-binding Lrp family transcriptional regulator